MRPSSLGDSLVLAWKANVKECQIELRQLNIELTVRAFDKATEQLAIQCLAADFETGDGEAYQEKLSNTAR